MTDLRRTDRLFLGLDALDPVFPVIGRVVDAHRPVAERLHDDLGRRTLDYVSIDVDRALRPFERRAALAAVEHLDAVGVSEFQARLAARRTKNWVDADRLRTELHAAGWEMEDRPDGYALKRK